jgi:hypothetical protein
MGDQNTVDVASAVHLNVLSDAGLLPAAELLAHDRPVPTTAVWTGVYLDDWLLVCFVRRADAKKPGPDSARAAEVSRAYVDAGLPEEKSNAFHQSLDFKAWGAFLQGGSGKLGAPAEVRRQLQRVTAALLALGWSTKKLLEQILGLYASIFIFRRNFFSVFHHLYTFCSEKTVRSLVPDSSALSG